MKRICSVLLLFAMLLSVIAVSSVMSTADNTASEIQFRGFDSQTADYACNAGTPFAGKSTGTNGVFPAVGTGFMGAKSGSEFTEMHHFIYAYNQNKSDAADGTNTDGVSKMLIEDPTQMYVSLDFYVSDASVVNNPKGDCGFGVDTLEYGTKENWGSTFYAPASVVKPLLKEVQTGWNHLLIPLSVKKSSLKTEMAGKTVTFCTMRLYAVGVDIPTGFVSAVDDVRVMNKQAALTVYADRTVAKSVTDGIRAYPASATYQDFYKLYAAYNAVSSEYQSLVIGWNDFIAANASHKAQGDTDLAADKAAAQATITAVEALNKTVTKEDNNAINTARADYEALTENQKILVTHVSVLAEAETQLAKIIKAENQAKADEVRALIAALPKTVTLNDKEAVEAARAAFNALTPEQQGMVINTKILETAESTLANLENQSAANYVFALIDALPQTITNADKAAVQAARDAFDGLTDDQKSLVNNLDKLEDAEEQAASLGDEPTPPAPTEYRLGDLDGDNEVNAKDALLVLKFAVGKIDKFPIEQ